MIDSLRSQVEEKLELRAKVQQLEQSLQHRKREVADLQAKVVQLNDRYRESFQEVRDLHFELSRHRFSGRTRSGPSARRR